MAHHQGEKKDGNVLSARGKKGLSLNTQTLRLHKKKIENALAEAIKKLKESGGGEE